MSGENKGRHAMQIGDLSKRAGLSVRTIRYYEELGLLSPASHSIGGFRLYEEGSYRRLQVIGFLKQVGLSLTEISRIFHAKKNSGGDKETVRFLQSVFGEKLRMVEAKLDAMSKLKTELAGALKILESCECCNHEVLLDALCCGNCSNLASRDNLPQAFEIMMQ